MPKACKPRAVSARKSYRAPRVLFQVPVSFDQPARVPQRQFQPDPLRDAPDELRVLPALVAAEPVVEVRHDDPVRQLARFRQLVQRQQKADRIGSA
jgi:hypothetical protein